MKTTFLSVFATILLFSACTQNAEKKVITKTDTVFVSNSSEHLSMATLWFQNSAEAAALYHQAYNIAKIRLDEKIKFHKKSDKKLAIITDLDETAIDNSPFQAKLIKENVHYSRDRWNAWVNEGRAKATPGAVEFFNYAASKGVKVIYLSNREDGTLPATIKNMKKLGFPNTVPENYLLKTKKSDKTERRAMVLKDYEVILYLGDNLLDFDEFFGQRTGADLGRKSVEERKAEFGNTFIVFPNPMYGNWEKAIYGGTYAKSADEKAKNRLEILQD